MNSRPSVIRFGYRLPKRSLANPLKLKVGKWLKRPYYSIRLREKNIDGLHYFGTFKVAYEVKFQLKTVPYEKILKVLRLCLKEIFYIVQSNIVIPVKAKEIRIVFNAPSLKSPINFKPVNLAIDGVDQMLSEIERNIQSNDNLLLDDLLEITFVCYKPPLQY